MKNIFEELDGLYDSVNQSLHGDIRGQVLALIEVTKTLASSVREQAQRIQRLESNNSGPI